MISFIVVQLGISSLEKINIPRQSRGYFLCGRSPMLPATPHAALVRLAICIGPSTHTGISPSPFPSHIAAIPNIYTFFFCLIIFHQQSLLLSHNLLNCLCHSFLSDLPLFCSLLLPDRIPTITVGVIFFLIGNSLFCTTRPASGFRDTIKTASELAARKALDGANAALAFEEEY